MISLHGVILNEDGTPFTGTKSLVLAKIYAGDSEADTIFSEVFTDVIVKNGYFRVSPGLTRDVAGVIRSNDHLYYDILVDGASIFDYEFQPLTASPYAIKSSYAHHGAGSPVMVGLVAPVGATYVDTQNRSLYVKVGIADTDWERIGE
jgi:hypothetical protein